MNVQPVPSRRLDLVWMSPLFLNAALNDRRADAEAALGIRLPSEFPGSRDRFLRMRLEQMMKDSSSAQWLTRAMVLRVPGRPMVGYIGFHSAPNEQGAVEIGYTVFGAHRGLGYALEAAQAMIDWARDEQGVSTFVASVGPWNHASLAIVRKLGFTQTGEQWDDEDGLELVFELHACRSEGKNRDGSGGHC